jgi:hypothetical protein
MKDAQESLRRHRETRMARKSEHIQPVLISAGPPKKIGILGKVKIAKQVINLYKTATSNNFAMNSKSLKTSIFGAGGLLTLWANVASMLLDNDPLTNPDWSMVITATITAGGLLFAKDYNASGLPNAK